MTKRLSFILIVGLSIVAETAQGHIALMTPTPRYAELKKGPCGRGAMDARTQTVTKFKAGETITVSWKETVGHPGHYRIAFDPDGAHFTDPSGFDDTAPRMYVLKDGIADKTGMQVYTEQITLPNMACTNCTLQVMQIMSDKPPYGDGNDLYYQCADLVLEGPPPNMDMGAAPDLAQAADLGATPDLGAPAEDPDPQGMNTGCSVSASGEGGAPAGGAGGAALLIGWGWVWRRRARRRAATCGTARRAC